MNCKFLTINIDDFGKNSIVVPDETIDYQSDERLADFIGKNRKILLRITSKFKGNANEVAMDLFEQFKSGL